MGVIPAKEARNELQSVTKPADSDQLGKDS